MMGIFGKMSEEMIFAVATSGQWCGQCFEFLQCDIMNVKRRVGPPCPCPRPTHIFCQLIRRKRNDDDIILLTFFPGQRSTEGYANIVKLHRYGGGRRYNTLHEVRQKTNKYGRHACVGHGFSNIYDFNDGRKTFPSRTDTLGLIIMRCRVPPVSPRLPAK